MTDERRATFEALGLNLKPNQIPERWADADYRLKAWEWEYVSKHTATFDPADKALADIKKRLEKLRTKEEKEAKKINEAVNKALAKIGPDGRRRARRARRRRTVPRST